ncbi:MAG: hypothetical protein ABSE92_10670 [Terriglobales bacterium]
MDNTLFSKRAAFGGTKPAEIVGLLSLSAGAFAVQGYHPGAEDAEIYLPGVEKILNPGLFPVNSEFFSAHAHLTLFPNLIAASVRLSHLSLDHALILWQLGSIFMLLLGCWKLSGLCFADPKARWAGVAMVGALLTLPVAGTALYVMDQYVNPRNLAAFAGIFAVTNVLQRKYAWCILWLGFAGSVHPLMACFAASFCLLMVAMERLRWPALLAVGPLGNWFGQATPAYHRAALEHPFHYIMKWAWYEWLGIVGPIPILWWMGRTAEKKGEDTLARLCRALIIYDIVYWAAACVISIPAKFEMLARLQPLRSLHLLYILLILIGGGFLGEYVLKNKLWRWLVVFVPLCAGMFMAQRAIFANSGHVEWTRADSKNPWAQAFDWVQKNTPEDAYFALDPWYSHINGEDEQGFRAIAERSMMADAGKDSGAVSMFPGMAEEWWSQVQVRQNWMLLRLVNIEQLHDAYHVNWVVVEQPAGAGLNCPYENKAVRVCRLD